MKKFVSGLLIGILLTLSITTFAAVELEIIPNPYKVLIDNKTSDVQGYNINGSTYLKLTDFVEAGLGVNFNKTTKQIEITTPAVNATESTTNKPADTTKEGETVNKQSTETKNSTPPKKADSSVTPIIRTHEDVDTSYPNVTVNGHQED